MHVIILRVHIYHFIQFHTMHYFRDNYVFLRIYLKVDYSYLYLRLWVLMLNNKRKYVLDTHLFFQVLISKRNECIFEIKIYSLFI